MKARMELVSFVSTAQVAQLLKRLRNLNGDQAQELALLRDEFTDPETLVRAYVEPHLQERWPNIHQQRGIFSLIPRQSAFALLNQFLGSTLLRSQDCSNQLFLLAEAGLGKTSLLLILKLLSLTKSWPQTYHCELFRLGHDTLPQLAAIKRKSDTILLLDGLNDDPLAHKKLEERLSELLEIGSEFRRVIITCRTHFFPDIYFNRSGQQIIHGLEGYNCPILHISPFNSQQAHELLRKQSAANSGYLGLQGFGAGRQKMRAALQVIEQIPLLRQNPLLLRHIELLLDAEIHEVNEAQNLRSLCEILFRQWLRQCQQLFLEKQTERQHIAAYKNMLKTCIKIACWMEKQNRLILPPDTFHKFFSKNGSNSWLEQIEPNQGALLEKKSNGSFRFAHAMFREFLLASALLEEPPPFLIRATEQLVHFLELAGGVAQHIRGLDFSDFYPHRYVEHYGTPLLWRDLFNRRKVRIQIGPELIILPGGRFRMGDFLGQGQENARPAHEVELDSFGIGRYPVTFAEFDEFCLSTGRARPRDQGWGRAQRPVINVSWQDAVDYCAWLTRKTGRHYRLPTEAEWEYACRAGSKANYCFGNNDEQLEHYAWYVHNAERQTHPVGTKKPNAWGIYDMHGNVWEWCAGWYAKDSYTYEPVRNPMGAGAEKGAGRVLRGGSWDSSTKFVTSHFRFCLSPGLRIIRAGFRVALGA